MANELFANSTGGQTVYAVLLNNAGQIWNGSAFVAINPSNWTSYDIALAEATAGIYLGSMPAAVAGVYNYVAYKQAGENPAITDIQIGSGSMEWDGSAEIVPVKAGQQMDLVNAPNGTALNAAADALLMRDWTSVGTAAARSVLNAMRFLRNKWVVTTGTLSVKKEDDSTEAWSASLTTDAEAVPITGSDPS